MTIRIGKIAHPVATIHVSNRFDKLKSSHARLAQNTPVKLLADLFILHKEHVFRAALNL